LSLMTQRGSRNTDCSLLARADEVIE